MSKKPGFTTPQLEALVQIRDYGNALHVHHKTTTSLESKGFIKAGDSVGYLFTLTEAGEGVVGKKIERPDPSVPAPTVTAAEVEQWQEDDEQTESLPGKYRVQFDATAELWVDVDATDVDDAIDKAADVARELNLGMGYSGSRHSVSVEPGEPYAVTKPDLSEEKVQPPYWVERNATNAELHALRDKIRAMAAAWPTEAGRVAVVAAVEQVIKEASDESTKVIQGNW